MFYRKNMQQYVTSLGIASTCLKPLETFCRLSKVLQCLEKNREVCLLWIFSVHFCCSWVPCGSWRHSQKSKTSKRSGLWWWYIVNFLWHYSTLAFFHIFHRQHSNKRVPFSVWLFSTKINQIFLLDPKRTWLELLLPFFFLPSIDICLCKKEKKMLKEDHLAVE